MINVLTYITLSRMRAAVHKFAIDKTSMNAYLYHRLLGHLVEERPIGCKLPKRYKFHMIDLMIL